MGSSHELRESSGTGPSGSEEVSIRRSASDQEAGIFPETVEVVLPGKKVIRPETRNEDRG